MALSRFRCLVPGKPHLFKVCVHIKEGLVKGNDILSRTVVCWLVDSQKPLSQLDSTALLLWRECVRSPTETPHCHIRSTDRVTMDNPPLNHLFRGYSRNGSRGLLDKRQESCFINKLLALVPNRRAVGSLSWVT
jgi:hypothetical protein